MIARELVAVPEYAGEVIQGLLSRPKHLPCKLIYDDRGSPGDAPARIEEVVLQSESPSARDLATGLIEGNPVGPSLRERGGVSTDALRDALAAALAREMGDRPARVTLRALVVSARARSAPVRAPGGIGVA